MKLTIRSFPAMAGLLCIAAGTLVAASAGQAAINTAAMRFVGTYRGTSSVPGGNGRMVEKIVGSGRATKLGASSLHSTATGLINPSGCMFMSGRGHLTAAGRGAIIYRFHLRLCFGGAFGRQKQPPQQGTFTITGGSGRLEGAQGSGTYLETFQNGQNVPPGGMTITFRGTLRLP